MVWLCSNEKCPDRSKRAQGSNCPSCGAGVQEFSFTKSLSHIAAKSKHASVETEKREALLLHEMKYEEIEEAIRRDLKELSSKHTWQSLADLMEGKEEDPTEAELLLRLNILVRQNELILRALGRTRVEPPSQQVAYQGTNPTS